MAFEIIWSDPANRQLKKLDRSVARRIFDKVGELAEDPHRFVQKLVTLRITDYESEATRSSLTYKALSCGFWS